MAIETEIKLRLADAEGFLRQLEPLNAVLLSPRHFEDNYVLDYADGSLRDRGCLLRVRITESEALLTYKEAARREGIFKVREELETSLGSGEVALEILCRLGMQLRFRYQKYRQEYSIAAGDQPGQEIHLAVDETPVGTFAELEGPEECIVEVANTMGFSKAQFIRESYYALYLQFCRNRGQGAKHMLF